MAIDKIPFEYLMYQVSRRFQRSASPAFFVLRWFSPRLSVALREAQPSRNGQTPTGLSLWCLLVILQVPSANKVYESMLWNISLSIFNLTPSSEDTKNPPRRSGLFDRSSIAGFPLEPPLSRKDKFVIVRRPIQQVTFSCGMWKPMPYKWLNYGLW